MVADEHNRRFSGVNRMIDRPRREFATLHCEKGPTGDPWVPPEVRKERYTRYLIKERAYTVSAEDTASIAENAMAAAKINEDTDYEVIDNSTV